MKCLDKDPNSRYDSAAALADELDRWLRNEPITARRATPSERLVKWVKRNPGAALSVSLISLLLAALIVTLIVSVIKIDGALTSERNAKNQKADALEKAEFREAEALAASQVAQQRLYASQIRLAQSALDQNQIGQVRKALDATDPLHRHWEWLHLNARCDGSIRTISIPPERAHRLAFTVDGAALSWVDESAARWLPLIGPPQVRKRTTMLKQGYVSGEPHPNVAWTHDRRYCVVASMGGLFVWEPSAEREIVLRPPADETEKDRISDLPTGVAIAADGKTVFQAWDQRLAAWDVAERRLNWEVPLAIGACLGMAISADGQKLAVNCEDTTVRVIDVGRHEEVFRTTEHRNVPTSLVFTADGKRLITGAAHARPRLWNIETKSLLTSFAGPASEFTTVLSPDTRTAATG